MKVIKTLVAGGATLGLLALLVLTLAMPATATQPEKITICHAAGQEGTTHFVTLTIGHEAVYGPAGHFFENGTPQAGHEQDYFGECHEEPVDVCPNLEGNQSEVPEGYVRGEDENGHPACVPSHPPTDTCPNLEGNQTQVPAGYVLQNGHCVPVTTPPPPPHVVTGAASVICVGGLYQVSGTVDGQAADKVTPATIPGNTKGTTQVTVTRGDTSHNTTVTTNGDCALPSSTTTTPPAATATPPAAIPPPPPVVVQPPATTPKPVAKPKPRTPAKRGAPKKRATPKKPHVCLPLADGTKRAWWKGGNGLQPGCYPIVEGSG